MCMTDMCVSISRVLLFAGANFKDHDRLTVVSTT